MNTKLIISIVFGIVIYMFYTVLVLLLDLHIKSFIQVLSLATIPVSLGLICGALVYKTLD